MSTIEKVFNNSKNLTVKYALALLEKEKCEKMLTLSYECQLQSDQVLANVRPDPVILEYLLVERILDKTSAVEFLRKQLEDALKVEQERLTSISNVFLPIMQLAEKIINNEHQ